MFALQSMKKTSLILVSLLLVANGLFSPTEGFAKGRKTYTRKPANTKQVDVVIVGAGLAGLSTAYRLKQSGISYHILELSPHIGGRIRTASYPGGFKGEVGLEEFWVGNPTLEIIDQLKIPIEKSATSFSSFMYEGKLYPFLQDTNTQFVESVFSKDDLAQYRKWDARASKLFEQTKVHPLSKELQELQEISFAEWVKKESGMSKMLQEFVRLQSEPEYALSWDSISALDGIMEWHIFSGAGSSSYHLVGGNQNLATKIAENIGYSNISLNSKVTRIVSEKDGVLVESVHQGDYQTQAIKGKFVVTTIPLFRLLEMQFVPALSEERKQAIMSQSWGSYFTAHVMIDAAAAKFWGGGSMESLPILTDSALGVIYGSAEADKKVHGAKNDVLLLNLLITGSYAERFNMRAATAMDSVRQELTEAFEKQWPGSSAMIKKFEFYQYHPRAIAAWPVGRSRLDEKSDLFRVPQGRVYFAGDFTESSHSDGAAISAIRVVKQITKTLEK
jgi:monoamine oxidase